MKITIRIPLDPDQMYKRAIAAGLPDSAAPYFSCLSDIVVTFDVDDDGTVIGAEITDHFESGATGPGELR